MTRILIVEDEVRISSFLEKGLKAHGFVTSISADAESALAIARDDDFDLLILDLGLPEMDGNQLLRRLRKSGQTMPVIILTARQSLSDKVAGFEGGADDYVTKPFAFDELLVRVRARLRTAGTKEISTLELSGVILDLRNRRARVGEKEVELSAREFLLAETLFRHAGQVLSREQLLSRVWGYDYDPGSNIVDVYVGYLRKKLGVGLVETVRGMGYRAG